MTGILFRREDVITDIIIISLLGSSSLVALLREKEVFVRVLLDFTGSVFHHYHGSHRYT